MSARSETPYTSHVSYTDDTSSSVRRRVCLSKEKHTNHDNILLVGTRPPHHESRYPSPFSPEAPHTTTRARGVVRAHATLLVPGIARRDVRSVFFDASRGGARLTSLGPRRGHVVFSSRDVGHARPLGILLLVRGRALGLEPRAVRVPRVLREARRDGRVPRRVRVARGDARQARARLSGSLQDERRRGRERDHARDRARRLRRARRGDRGDARGSGVDRVLRFNRSTGRTRNERDVSPRHEVPGSRRGRLSV